MTQVYNEAGEAVPVTVIQAGPCRVLQVKTLDRDGYEAVQVGYLDKARRRASRSERGHVAKLDSKRVKSRTAAGVELPAKAGCEPKRFIREFPTAAGSFNGGVEVGGEVKVDSFADVLRVDVTATSKGRGFSGAMKRHNFAGQRATHGVKKCHRHLGGTGCSAYPSRVMKGVSMPGQYGNVKTTVRNQRLVSIDVENNLLVLNGAVPGPNGGLVVVRTTNKLK
ncbi:50S ribosomal protein L3 [Botrimarina hoheduenensis]|nr:50S ribosomal protein L3 [Botrimarina hoheduenensis]